LFAAQRLQRLFGAFQLLSINRGQQNRKQPTVLPYTTSIAFIFRILFDLRVLRLVGALAFAAALSWCRLDRRRRFCSEQDRFGSFEKCHSGLFQALHNRFAMLDADECFDFMMKRILKLNESNFEI
jgi:hypothetical protein